MSCRLNRFACLVLTLHIIQSLTATPAHAVAYCALRDPVASIYTLFPAADTYRSLVGTVGRDVRAAMQQDIPFNLHFNELGRHTLYVAQRGTEPLGLVHARSEKGTWGIDEFVWSISPSLRILGVKIQRTRDFTLRKDGVGLILQPLVGLDLQELLDLYATGRLEGRAATLLKSAIKTLYVTKYVWKKELHELSALTVALRGKIPAQKVERVANLYDENISSKLQSFDMEVSPVFDRDLVVGYQIIGHQGKPAGLAVHTSIDMYGPNPLWWVVDLRGNIRYVGEVDGLNAEFSSALGQAPLDSRDCSSAIDLAALEIATLARNR